MHGRVNVCLHLFVVQKIVFNYLLFYHFRQSHIMPLPAKKHQHLSHTQFALVANTSFWCLQLHFCSSLVPIPQFFCIFPFLPTGTLDAARTKKYLLFTLWPGCPSCGVAWSTLSKTLRGTMSVCPWIQILSLVSITGSTQPENSTKVRCVNSGSPGKINACFQKAQDVPTRD